MHFKYQRKDNTKKQGRQLLNKANSKQTEKAKNGKQKRK